VTLCIRRTRLERKRGEGGFIGKRDTSGWGFRVFILLIIGEGEGAGGHLHRGGEDRLGREESEEKLRGTSQKRRRGFHTRLLTGRKIPVYSRGLGSIKRNR